MGFLSKLWKGIKGRFKKIGKGIKKAFRSVGKFMDKIGIVGQIALMFVLPGIGNALMSTVSGWATQMLGASSSIVRGMGMVLNTAHKFATTVGNVYKTVTGAVTDFIGTAGKYIGSQFGPEAGKMTLKQAWGTYTNEVMKNVTHIADPFKKIITINPRDTIGNLAKSSGISPKDFIEKYEFKNPELVNHMKGLAEQGGKALTDFSPSTYTKIGNKSFEVERKVDFWGRDKSITPPEIITEGVGIEAAEEITYKDAFKERLEEYDQKILDRRRDIEQRRGPIPRVVLDSDKPPVPQITDSLLDPPVYDPASGEYFRQAAEGQPDYEALSSQIGPEFYPDAEKYELTTGAKISKYAKKQGEIFIGGLPQQALNVGLQRVVQGDPPDYPEPVIGGVPSEYVSPYRAAFAPSPTIEATGLEFYLAGNNTFADGMWGRPQYNTWMQRGLQARGGTYG